MPPLLLQITDSDDQLRQKLNKGGGGGEKDLKLKILQRDERRLAYNLLSPQTFVFQFRNNNFDFESEKNKFPSQGQK